MADAQLFPEDRQTFD